MRKTASIAVIIFIVLSICVASAQTTNVTVTVGSMAGPWNWVNGGLNTAFQYNAVSHDFTSPVVVSAVDGVRFSVGDSLTISYVGGTVSYSGSPTPFFNANGDTSFAANDNSASGQFFPSLYMSPYPIYRAELVGTFADNSGQIVGTPFAIGNLGTFTVPSGATRLQLGVNDSGYGDNRGSWSIQITGAAVPEPTSIALVSIGLLSLGFAARFRRQGL